MDTKLTPVRQQYWMDYVGCCLGAKSAKGLKTSNTTFHACDDHSDDWQSWSAAGQIPESSQCGSQAHQILFMKIIIADDHELFHEGRLQLLQKLTGDPLVFQAANYPQLLAPDALLSDSCGYSGVMPSR